MHYFRSFRSKLPAVAGVGTAAAVAAPAFAAIDTTGVETAIGEAATSVATIGAAVILVMVGIAVYKWIRRAL